MVDTRISETRHKLFNNLKFHEKGYQNLTNFTHTYTFVTTQFVETAVNQLSLFLI